MGNEQEDKKKANDEITRAINNIANTKDGKIFFRWMAHRCFHTRSTIVGNPESHEINAMGSVANAYVQRLFQDIYRVIRPEIRIKLDYPNDIDEHNKP